MSLTGCLFEDRFTSPEVAPHNVDFYFPGLIAFSLTQIDTFLYEEGKARGAVATRYRLKNISGQAIDSLALLLQVFDDTLHTTAAKTIAQVITLDTLAAGDQIEATLDVTFTTILTAEYMAVHLVWLDESFNVSPYAGLYHGTYRLYDINDDGETTTTRAVGKIDGSIDVHGYLHLAFDQNSTTLIAFDAIILDDGAWQGNFTDGTYQKHTAGTDTLRANGDDWQLFTALPQLEQYDSLSLTLTHP